MHHQPLVTIVCLCYNHEDYVIEALESVINQDYKHIELIIVDDFSSDNSVTKIEKWLKKHPEVLFLKNSENLGNTKSFNKAFKKSNGKYVIDLAADDVLLTHCVSAQIKTFQNTKFKNLAIVYGNAELINENGDLNSIYYKKDNKPESGNIYNMVIGRKTMICSVSSIIKSDIFKSLGGYDESLMHEDIDLWVRASRKYEFEYIPEIIVKKRELRTSLSAQFSKKSNSITNNLHLSSFKVLNKIYRLNTTKEEYQLMLNRIRFEMYKFIASKSIFLLVKLLWLEFKVRFKIFSYNFKS